LQNPQGRDRAAYELVSRYENFDAFVDNWLRPENITKQIHFTPQHYFLQDAMGHLSVDFIGRQETLNHDFRKLCIHLHVKAELQHINRSPAPDNQFIQFCSAATRRRVRDVYARDYELFDYD
jgi:hypothetical protein